MQSEQLKAIQAPFKQRYSEDPDAAVVTLAADGELGEGVSCSVQTGRTLAEAGLHPATGGDGLSLCSGDMLLEALAACAGVTLNAVATATGFDLQDAYVLTEGDLDFRGTLSVDKTAPVGFKEIRMRFEIKTSEPEEKTTKLIQLTERFCVVYQTLVKGSSIPVTVRVIK